MSLAKNAINGNYVPAAINAIDGYYLPDNKCNKWKLYTWQ